MKTIRRRLVCLLLSAVLLLSMIPAAFAASAAGLDNFKRVNTYTPGHFTDVDESIWYASNIKSAYELNLTSGTGPHTFDPQANMTVVMSIALAARLHAIYHTGSAAALVQGSPWYQVYVDYALANGIMEPGQFTLDPAAIATRAQCAVLLSKAIPAAELPAVNTVDDGAIPDVAADSPYYEAIYALYRAGILTGNDAKGTFTPDAPIDRASMLTIATRLVDKSLRKDLTLKVELTGIQVKPTLWLFPGDTYQLSASPVPSGAKLPAVTWSSADTKIATVSATGLVTMVAPGKTTVTVKTADGKSASCTVNVMKREVAGVTLDQTSVNTYPGQSFQLKPTIDPANATDQTLTWTSSNPAVATVSSTGLVNVLAVGTTTVAVKTGNGKTATCTVNVTEIGTIANPIPADGSMVIPYQEYSFYPTKNLRITCTNVIAGSAANALAKSENRYNDTPNSNQEWRFYEFSVNYISCESGSAVLKASNIIYDDTFFTTTGTKANVADIATLGNQYKGYGVFDVELYPGATGKVVIGLLINKNAGDLLLRVPGNEGDDVTWVLCTKNGTSSTPSTPSTPSVSSKAESYYYVGYPGVPSFGNCLGISPIHSTGDGGYFYSSTDIDASGYEDTFVYAYDSRLTDCGFTYLGNQTSDGNTVAIYYNSSTGYGVAFGATVVGYTVGILVAVNEP